MTMTKTANALTLDVQTDGLRAINQRLQNVPKGSNETHWTIANPAGEHALAAGLQSPIHVEIMGTAGYYCAGMNKEATVIVHGNVSTGVANQAYFEKTGERKFMVGVDLHAVMLANQIGGVVRVSGAPVRVGRRITVVRTQVWGDEGRLLAEVTSTHVPT